jgi:hypothetical protein
MYVLRGQRLAQMSVAIGATGVALMKDGDATVVNDRLGLGSVVAFRGDTLRVQFTQQKALVTLGMGQFVALFGIEGAPLNEELLEAVRLFQDGDAGALRAIVEPALVGIEVPVAQDKPVAMTRASKPTETLEGIRLPPCAINGFYIPEVGELLELKDGSKIKVVRRGSTHRQFVATKPRGKKEFEVDASQVVIPDGVVDVGQLMEIRGRIGHQRPFTLFNVKVKGSDRSYRVRVNRSKLKKADPYYLNADVTDMTVEQKALVMVAVGLLSPDGVWNEYVEA